LWITTDSGYFNRGFTGEYQNRNPETSSSSNLFLRPSRRQGHNLQFRGGSIPRGTVGGYYHRRDCARARLHNLPSAWSQQIISRQQPGKSSCFPVPRNRYNNLISLALHRRGIQQNRGIVGEIKKGVDVILLPLGEDFYFHSPCLVSILYS